MKFAIWPRSREHTIALTAGLLLAGWVSLPVSASTNSVLMGLDDPFGGTVPALTNTPWVGLTFQNVAPGQVRLTVSGLALTSTEDLTGLYLNLNPSLNPAKLLFTEVSETGGFAAPLISRGEDKFRAANSGKYDVRLVFNNDLNDRFTSGASVTYLISGIASLTAADFAFVSSGPGGAGPFYSAAYIEHLANCDPPGWIGTHDVSPIPEPSTNLLIAVGFCFCLAQAARRRAPLQLLQPSRIRSPGLGRKTGAS